MSASWTALTTLVANGGLVLCANKISDGYCRKVTAISASNGGATPSAGTFTVSTGWSIVDPVNKVNGQNLLLIDTSVITKADVDFVGGSYTPSLSTLPTATEQSSAFLTYIKYYPGKLHNYLAAGYADPSNLDSCVVDPRNYGYLATYDTSKFGIKYNVRTVMLAIAVNLGHVPLKTLQPVQSDLMDSTGRLSLISYDPNNDPIKTKAWVEYDAASGFCTLTYANTDKYKITNYVDPRFDYMDPIYCLEPLTPRTNPKNENVCVVRIGPSFAYPTFNHAGMGGGEFPIYRHKLL